MSSAGRRWRWSRHQRAVRGLTKLIALTPAASHPAEGATTVFTVTARFAPVVGAGPVRTPSAVEVVRSLEEALQVTAALQRLAGAVGLDTDEFIRLLELSVAEAMEPVQGVFSTAETRALAEAGVDLSGPSGDAMTADAHTADRALAQQSQSWSVAQAAELLGRTPRRVRQRIAGQTLYALRAQAGQLRLPRWQFTDHGVIPGLEKVIPALSRSLHPVSVERFMRTPLAELEVAGEPLSPLQWLSRGGDPTEVAQIAAGLPSAG